MKVADKNTRPHPSQTKGAQAIRMAHRLGYRVRRGVVFNPSGKRLRTWNYTKSTQMPYQSFNIRPKGQTFRVMVHRLVAYEMYGELVFARGMQCRHLDGNPKNNNHLNIALGTASDNQMDRPAADRKKHALKASSKCMKYDDAFIQQIQDDRWFRRSTYEELSKKYGLCRSMLSYHLSDTAKFRRKRTINRTPTRQTA